MNVESGADIFDGTIDPLNDGLLRLWVWMPGNPEKTIFVDIFVNEKFVGCYLADEFRQDLLDAGIGTGHHSLVVDLTDALAQYVDEPTIEVTASTSEPPRRRFASLRVRSAMVQDLISNDLVVPEPLAGRLRELFTLNVQNAGRYFKFDLLPATSVELKHRKVQTLFEPSLQREALAGRFSISKYADFVRHRFRVADQYDTDGSISDVDDFLKWYLEFYCVSRGTQRAPLSSAEISRLNEVIHFGGQQYQLSRATWIFLLGNKIMLSALDLNSRDSYIEIVYWWAVERARSMFVEDCLVPPSYRSLLNEVREKWRTQDFPLSRFMEVYYSRNVHLHTLDLLIGDHRLFYYVILMLSAFNTPFLLQYIPRFWVQKLLATQDDGLSLFRQVCDQVFRGSVSTAHISDYKSVMLRRGFDIERQQSLALSAEGHRVFSVSLRLDARGPVDVQLIGPIGKASGLGQATRLSADALSRSNFSHSFYDFDMDNPAPVGFSSKRELSSLRSASVNLIHLNAESIPLAFAFLPDVFTNAYNIGYFFWELDTPAKCHMLALELLDEIWVSSEYGLRIYKSATTRPVTNVGMCFEDLPVPDRSRARQFLTSRLAVSALDFVFFAAFDSFSFIQRKNPQGVVRAFREAFTNGENVRLILKTHNKDFVSDPAQVKIWRFLSEIVAIDPRITIVNETLPYDELLLMKTGCDCYVSLHRSEGWGFGMLEAMHLGLPVLATNYSGNTEFCTPKNSWMVDYTLQPVKQTDYIFVTPGQQWAEPVHADAIRQMQRIVRNSRDRDRRATLAQAFVRQNFSPDAISRRYSERLNTIFAR